MFDVHKFNLDLGNALKAAGEELEQRKRANKDGAARDFQNIRNLLSEAKQVASTYPRNSLTVSDWKSQDDLSLTCEVLGKRADGDTLALLFSYDAAASPALSVKGLDQIAAENMVEPRKGFSPDNLRQSIIAAPVDIQNQEKFIGVLSALLIRFFRGH